MTMRRDWQLLPLTLVCRACRRAASRSTVGKDTPQQAQFRIVDRNGAPAPAARQIGRDLVIAPQPGASVDDSYRACLFAHEPAACRLPVRVVERPSLEPLGAAAGRSALCAQCIYLGRAGRPRRRRHLQLNLSVNDFFHDAATDPGTARVEVSAELSRSCDPPADRAQDLQCDRPGRERRLRLRCRCTEYGKQRGARSTHHLDRGDGRTRPRSAARD